MTWFGELPVLANETVLSWGVFQKGIMFGAWNCRHCKHVMVSVTKTSHQHHVSCSTRLRLHACHITHAMAI